MEEAIRSSVWVTSPEYSGWLFKRGFHWRKLWKKRWVAISGAELAYADKEPAPNESASTNSKIDIKKCPITSSMVIDRDDIDGNPNGFAIHINDGKSPVWYLRADSLREKKSWLMRLGHVHTIVRWLDDFERVKVLGVGGTGIVYELKSKNDSKRYAMKEMEIKNTAQMKMALKEAEMLKDIMENISHPHIMHIEKVFQVGSKFYMVFPLCTGGELYEHIIRRGHFTEADAARLMRDLISGIHALHENDILHLDIKPENLLFESMASDAKIKITDFGLSKVFHDSEEVRRKEPTIEELEEKTKAFIDTGILQREKLRGTVGYMSPELILLGVQSKATDIWAAGVVLYILLCGYPPFHSKSNREILEKSAKGEYSMESKDWEGISEEAKDLVCRMLTVDLAKRITAGEILSHPFIASCSCYQEAHSAPETNVHEIESDSVQNTRSINLDGALKRLSDHVGQRRTEKMAVTLTKMLSTLKNGPSQQSQMLTLLCGPITNKSPKEIEEEVFQKFMNPDARKALNSIFHKLGSSDEGKLTLEQFTSVLRHFGVGSSSIADNNSVGQWFELSGLLISKFIDRDGDGLISADDIFTAQALIIQRSEVFIRFVFRIYQEAIWYPGRQLNQLNWLSSNSNTKSSLTTPRSKGVIGDFRSGGTGLDDVVEPPKFITSKNIISVFDRLGFDSVIGQKIFSALYRTINKNKSTLSPFTAGTPFDGNSFLDHEDSLSRSLEYSMDSHTPNAALAAALFDDSDDEDKEKDIKKNVLKSEDSNQSSNQQIDSMSPKKKIDALVREDDSFSAKERESFQAVVEVDSNSKMDINDFIKAAEFDDVLIQIILLRNRVSVAKIFDRDNLNQSQGILIQTEKLEKEFTTALGDCNLRNSAQSQSRFPIASAVGATLSAVAGAFGFISETES